MTKGRSIKNYLLNRPFQLKYAALVVGLSSVLSVGLGFFVLAQMNENTRMLRLQAEFDPIIAAELSRSDASTTLGLVTGLLAFNFLLFLGSIVVTHRMAGPVYVLGRCVRMVSQGRLPIVRKLRKHDEFRDLHAAVVDMVVHLSEETRAEMELIQQALNELPEDAGSREPLNARMRELRRRIEEAVTPTQDMVKTPQS
ncbi:MAG: hypothetical protein AAGD10_13580 [Myxococcota bacterium]